MQGVEFALLLGICSAVLGICFYTRNTASLLLILLFGDYFAIEGKIQFGYRVLGAYKELSLSLICAVLLLIVRQSIPTRISRVLMVLFAWLIVALSLDFRPFSGLLLAVVAGWLMADSRWKLQPHVPFLCLVSAIICAYQFVYVKDMDGFWFYDFLTDKEGLDYGTSFYTYFRNGTVRPTGYLVSPSTFGFVFILFSYLVEKWQGARALRLATKLLCFGSLLMIQTRALLIIFIAYEVQRFAFPTLKPRRVVWYYGVVLAATFAVTLLYGDEGALVRIFLFSTLISGLTTGATLIPFGSGYDGPVDSQFVAFVRLFGLPGLIFVALMFRSIYRQSQSLDSKQSTTELSFICVLLFINVFQWSDSSPGNLLGWMILAYYAERYNLASRRIAQLSTGYPECSYQIDINSPGQQGIRSGLSTAHDSFV